MVPADALFPEVAGKRFRVQLFPGGELRQAVPGVCAAVDEHFVLHPCAYSRVAGIVGLLGINFQYIAAKGVVNLRGEELAHHVVVVVGWCGANVNLGTEVRGITTGGAFEPLVLLDQSLLRS